MDSHPIDYRVIRRARSTGFQTPRERTDHLGDRHTSKKENPTKPLIDWLARKLGQGRAQRAKQGSSRRVTSVGAPKGILNRGNANDVPSLPLPRARQRSTAPAPSIRLSTTRPASTRTRHSGRSYQPSSIFSPSRHRACPRASFITRSSASPTHSPSLSPSSSSQSLASSYLALEDPDSRSYITSLSLPDDNASTHPIPPSRADSPVLSIAASLPSSIHFQAQLFRATIHTSSQQPHSVKNRSRSASQSTSTSSYGSPNKTTRSIASTKPTTIFTTESEVALGLGQPLAQIARAPRFLFSSTDELLAGDSRPPGNFEAGSLLSPIRTFSWSSLTGDRSRIDHPQTHVPAAQGMDVYTGNAASSSPPSPSFPLQHSEEQKETSHVPHGHPFHVPRYSLHRPELNPSPSAEPRANASMHTLASSNFADARVHVHLEDQAFALSRAESREPSQMVHRPATLESFDRKDHDSFRTFEPRSDHASHRKMSPDKGSSNPATPYREGMPLTNGFGERLVSLSDADQNGIPVSHIANDTNREFARILGAVSQLDCEESSAQQMDEGASVMGLRGRSNSWGSDVSRFSWAPVPNAKSAMDPAHFSGPHQASKPPSFTKSALGKPLSIKSSAY